MKKKTKEQMRILQYRNQIMKLEKDGDYRNVDKHDDCQDSADILQFSH